MHTYTLVFRLWLPQPLAAAVTDAPSPYYLLSFERRAHLVDVAGVLSVIWLPHGGFA